ncbi:Coproporphyrinogen-III oxidase [Quaeritorhiza haematococci]|nr:Coproporphyrinogen-III oxidase [Quaeritorhiza haematococci]
MRARMERFIRDLQEKIVAAVEEVEGPESAGGKRFRRDLWIRPQGGMGKTVVLQDGKYFEKAGVGVSVVHGPVPAPLLKQMRARKKEDIGEGPFNMFAAGISLVFHPHNPNAPTVHFNYRYFELVDANGDSKEPKVWWFGGGCDLTPAYLYEEDAKHFHQTIKKVCDKHSPDYYPEFKKWCDDYFNITHRGERRGIGGIFFDDLEGNGTPEDRERIFKFVQECGHTFLKQYIPIVEKRKDMPFTEEMKQWQQLRRGRYVEFNLVCRFIMLIDFAEIRGGSY